MPPLPGYKYWPLANFLTAQPTDEVTLSFAPIEEVVGAPLPAVAVTRWWWTAAGARYVRAQAWRAAGWDVTAVTWRDREWWVTFQRRLA